jgi:hypothetical protein
VPVRSLEPLRLFSLNVIAAVDLEARFLARRPTIIPAYPTRVREAAQDLEAFFGDLFPITSAA